jgi:nucleoside 2-deoxyribosyltransferase
MKEFTVYLGGPMEGVSHELMVGWRQLAKFRLGDNGIDYRDPCRRIAFHAPGELVDQNRARMVFRADLRDIDECDAVLADVRRKQGRGTGTSMEIMYAWMKHKPIFLWADPEDEIHPFYESMYTEKHFTLEATLNSIIDFKQ